MEKKKASSTNSADKTGCQHVEEYKQIHIHPYAQNSSTNLQSSQIKPTTMNLIQEKMQAAFNTWAY